MADNDDVFQPLLDLLGDRVDAEVTAQTRSATSQIQVLALLTSFTWIHSGLPLDALTGLLERVKRSPQSEGRNAVCSMLQKVIEISETEKRRLDSLPKDGN